MTLPIHVSFGVLAKSRNEAATATLMLALESPESSIRQLAVMSLAVRRSKAGHKALLQRWNTLTAEHGEALNEARGRMGAALRDALLGDDDRLFENAVAATQRYSEFDVLPTLIAIAEHPTGDRRRRAAELVQQLVGELGSLLHTSPEEYSGRDPQQIRDNVLDSLERSVERFRQHKCDELIEAFVTLAGPGSETLSKIIDAPHHPCFQTVVNTLTRSSNPNVIQLLLAFMRRPEAPRVVRNVVSKRTDQDFLIALTAAPIEKENTTVRQNLARITSLAWQVAPTEKLVELPAENQATAIRLAALSGVDAHDAVTFFQWMFRRAEEPARREICESLQHIPGERANDLILRALDDEEGSVQAAAARQLRNRHIKGAVARLIARLDSPHDDVRTAVREALTEFSFENYVSKFDTMDDALRANTGDLVKRIDPTSIDRLRRELGGPLRAQRRRAIDMAQAMSMLPDVADEVVELLSDDDPTIREAAAEALQECTGADVRNALLSALQDSSTSVRAAAEASLAKLAAAPPAKGGAQ